MATNGLPFETLASILPGKFNFIGLRTDRKRRRSKCSEKLSTFPAKCEPLAAERSANLLRLNAAYLTMFTENNVEHVVCHRSRGGLPLDQSLMLNLYFSTCFKAAFHLVLSHTDKWIRPEMRQNLPPTRTWARKTGALGPNISNPAPQPATNRFCHPGANCRWREMDQIVTNLDRSRLSALFTVGRFSVAGTKITHDDQVANQMDAVRISESTPEAWALPGHW
jgi:hypothetical protein